MTKKLQRMTPIVIVPRIVPKPSQVAVSATTAVYDGLEILCALAPNTGLRLRVRNRRSITAPPLQEVPGRRQSRPKGISPLIPFLS
jgi:hypothetical protein